MLKLVVCIKQVPLVSELPWDKRTGTLKREMAEGMMNPVCRRALEAAVRIKETAGAHITALSMGPPMAAEVLHEALALGADAAVLLTDRAMAGADTLSTSATLAAAVRAQCPDFDLLLCGAHTTDSETAQVGPQLAAELDVPGVAYVESLELRAKNTVRLERAADGFIETLDMALPGVVTISPDAYAPRFVPLGGLNDSFDQGHVTVLDAAALGLDPARMGIPGSPTKILNVYSPTAAKKNVVLTGAPQRVVEQLFEKFGDQIGGAIKKDVKEHQ